MTLNPLREAIDEWLPEIDFGVMRHGFADHGRDYVFILEVGAAAGGATYELTLTHVVELRYESGVHDEALTKSWDDVFTDYAAWEAAGGPDGYVWGTNWSLAYPGLSAPDDDPAAQAWSKRLAKPMYRALIETDRFSLSVIFHSARWKKLCEGAPTVEQVLIPMA